MTDIVSDKVKEWVSSFVAGWVNQRFYPRISHRSTRVQAETNRHLPIIANSEGYIDATFVPAVTNAMLADMAQSTIKGRAAGAGTGDPTDLSAAQVAAIINTSLDHGALVGLADDDHSQYPLLAGRSGGQTLKGGTASGNDLTLESTNHATKGDVILNPTGGFVGIGTTDPDGLEVDAAVAETAQGRDNVRLGVAGGTPRVILETDASGGSQWEIDNSAGTLRFYYPGVLKISFDSSGNVIASGLNLGEDTLSVYDEGTWTPVVTASSSDPTVAYTTQNGRYTRFNNMVMFQAYILISSFSGGSGSIRVSLPIAANGEVQRCHASLSGMTDTGNGLLIQGANTYGNISFATGTLVAVGDVSASDSIAYSGVYFV